MRFSTLLSLVAGATTVLAGVENFNPTGQGCVDPDAYLSCYQKQIDLATGCADSCNKTNSAGSNGLNTCLMGCNGAHLAGNLACWVEGCWNQLYSCESQLATISYWVGTDLIPNSQTFSWYPPPEDAVDGTCSCNLGYVYGNKTILLTTPNFNEPCNNAAMAGDPETLFNCQCCEFSMGLSNILNTCPTSDLSILGIASDVASAQRNVGNSGNGCAILNDGNINTCYNAYGYVFRGSEVYNPLSLPDGVPGTDPLTNNPGNAFTGFASEFTMALFPGFTSTITPAPFDAKAGAPTDKVEGGDVATATGTASASGTAKAGSGGKSESATPGSGLPTSSGSAAATSTGAAVRLSGVHGAIFGGAYMVAVGGIM